MWPWFVEFNHISYLSTSKKKCLHTFTEDLLPHIVFFPETCSASPSSGMAYGISMPRSVLRSGLPPGLGFGLPGCVVTTLALVVVEEALGPIMLMIGVAEVLLSDIEVANELLVVFAQRWKCSRWASPTPSSRS